MQVLAPADPFFLWLHGVGHDGQWRCGAAPPFPPRPHRSGVGCARSGAPAGPRAPIAGRAAMTDGDPRQTAMADVPVRHVPVLLSEVIANLSPHDGGVYIA